MDIKSLKPHQLALLIENRWASSETVWDIVQKSYERNIRTYKNDPEWADPNIAIRKRATIRANRIFRNTESVINALIANPPKPNMLPGRDTDAAKTLAVAQEKYMLRKYDERNVKEVFRKGLRNLYFGRLIVLKPFWNAKINDFDVRSLDPRKVRLSRSATKEEDSEFAIEEVTDNLMSVMQRFPAEADYVMKASGFANKESAYINNPDVTYKEAWIGGEYVICKYRDKILSIKRNPYWDWDGLMVTPEEENQLGEACGEDKKTLLSSIRAEQEARKTSLQAKIDQQNAVSDQGDTSPDQFEEAPQHEEAELRAYYFNHFNNPRKPYIIATIFNNENTPVGQTDMIYQATPLQEGVDRRKVDIDENASLVNGQIKVDSSVMSKADAQKLRYEARGVIWGKGVATGVTRETGQALPQFVFEDMVDSRQEIDNIMAASSAFRGEREGQETKAGRLALIDQSYLALNELVQVVDYCSEELFNWFYQLAKVRYTEHHYAKIMGKDGALEVISLMQDDFQDGTEVRIIPGKTLPEDRQFKYEQAQADVEKGILSPVDYFQTAGYVDPKEKAKNAVVYQLNPAIAVGITPEELQVLAPAKPPEEKPPSASISFKDLPPDGQIQLAAKAGLELNPSMLIAEKIAQINKEKQQTQREDMRTEAQINKANQPPVKAKPAKT